MQNWAKTMKSLRGKLAVLAKNVVQWETTMEPVRVAVQDSQQVVEKHCQRTDEATEKLRMLDQ